MDSSVDLDLQDFDSSTIYGDFMDWQDDWNVAKRIVLESIWWSISILLIVIAGKSKRINKLVISNLNLKKEKLRQLIQTPISSLI